MSQAGEPGELTNEHQNAENPWIALNIGNSRLHWAWFFSETLQAAWETPYQMTTMTHSLDRILDRHLPLNLSAGRSCASSQNFELWIASVIPEQTTHWQRYPGARVITLDQIPLQATYPTLGIDRALALWRAGDTWGWPTLVIDAGTALTFTGADADGQFVGGAILPGLGLQLRSLAQFTAALPLVELTSHLPNRWAVDTPEAIQSGAVYTVLAGIQDFVQTWYREFPQSQIVITGGDHLTLLSWLTQVPQASSWVSQIVSEPHLVLLGIQSLRRWLKSIY